MCVSTSTHATRAALITHFRNPAVFVYSWSCPGMATFVRGPYLNTEPEPWLLKDSVQSQTTSSSRSKVLSYFFFGPHPVPWGSVGTCLHPWCRWGGCLQQAALQRDGNPVLDAGLRLIIFMIEQVKSSSHSLPRGQRSCFLPYVPVIKGCLNWVVPQICRFGLGNSEFPR